MEAAVEAEAVVEAVADFMIVHPRGVNMMNTTAVTLMTRDPGGPPRPPHDVRALLLQALRQLLHPGPTELLAQSLHQNQRLHLYKKWTCSVASTMTSLRQRLPLRESPFHLLLAFLWMVSFSVAISPECST